ncbi:Rne/Rng family ribonuclease [Kocuria tytonis]|uniref:Ribonuclease E n=1 Tax=Kocuria tytonis TaxID=2054280 RepID=A0A495A941_9MICC|nr:Rne/Rng family ribonuclease [Kocuria tytonis]RKQ36527.1 Rne/Rng family ribonuclease [Kocuria tytonis]
MEPEQDNTAQSPFEAADPTPDAVVAADGDTGETTDSARATAESTDPAPAATPATDPGQTPTTGTDPADTDPTRTGDSADIGVTAAAGSESPVQPAPTATEADGTTAAAAEAAPGQAPAGEPTTADADPETTNTPGADTVGAVTAAAAEPAPEDPASLAADAAAAADSGAAEDSADPEPPTQEDFGTFGPGASLMFHAPDPDEIRRAAEAHAERLRELAREREAQREAERAARRENREQDEDDDESGSASSKRRRRRRRGDEDMELVDESDGSVTRVRAPRGASEGTSSDEVTGVKGSTRLEAKRQRRRESRQSGRRRHVITEAEFLARRESVERTMLVRQKEDRIQIGVLEDGILAEHFVSHTTQDSLIGNVYVGKVQNVLPSMEAAFVDIGRGRNAVLYAGEVDWDAAEMGNKPRKIENALRSGDTVLVQVTKDPVGHKGARLTSQVSLPGRYLVYVPGGSMTGISRKLPDVERQRLKKILKDRLPEGAGVIVRTAAEGASETELTNDINRLRSQWEQIQEKARSNKTLAPELLYAEPDLTIKTVRDVFNEDFTAMVVQGEQAWDNIEAYVTYVAPDLLDRLQRWTEDADLFEHMRVAEQIQKALERKVFLPSGGSLVIDRTEAMTVVDVNTGKFTGSGGNLEETVTKNNLEAAEEIVRQLRLRDIGGIIVVDFIDMVLESNRDLVLRRLVECLGRDRTKHQVAEVTSLGLVQMTRKRMGTGLLEVFSEPCEECAGRGVVVHDHPLKGRSTAAPQDHRGNRTERKRSRQKQHEQPKDKPRSSDREGSDDQQQAREEATRTAFANIAAASSHEDDAAQHGSEGGSGSGTADAAKGRDASGQQPGQGSDRSSDSGHGDSEAGRRRKKRRGKRSRGRGQQGEDNGSQQESSPQDAAADRDGTDPASRLTIGGEVIELPQGQQEEQDRRTAEESLTLDSLSAAFSGEDTAPAGSGTGSGSDDESRKSGSGRQRRGRRVATAPGTAERRADTAGRDTAARDGSGTRDASRHDSPAQQEHAVTRGGAETTKDANPARGTESGSASGTRGTGASAPAARSTAAQTGTGQPAQETPARRRRGSRRAVAPTAAPGTAAVEKREYSAAEAAASRFTATATPVTPAASDGGPTVVGVGVSARDITMTPKAD